MQTRAYKVPAAIWFPIHDFFKGDLRQIESWMHHPNPMLENFSPFQLIANGRTKYLQERIESIVKGTHNIVKPEGVIK